MECEGGYWGDPMVHAYMIGRQVSMTQESKGLEDSAKRATREPIDPDGDRSHANELSKDGIVGTLSSRVLLMPSLAHWLLN